MIMRLILWLSVLWIAPLVVGVLVNDAKFKKNLAVGVTIPPEFQADPDIAAHLARFRRQEWTLCVILVLAAVPCIFVRDFGRNMTLWSVWLLLVCVLPYAPYARCNLALKRLKAEVAVSDLVAAHGLTGHAAALDAAVLNTLRQ